MVVVRSWTQEVHVELYERACQPSMECLAVFVCYC